MQITGRKAIVFGGTSGIGLATARQLAERGASVVAISRNPDKADRGAEELPDGVATRACDVRDRDALEVLLNELAPYDILISAATGGGRAKGPFIDMDFDGFQASFDKLWGYANVVQLGARHLPEHGCIVLVSGSPARKCKPGQVALSAVGGAVEALVRAVAPEIAPVRINTLSPGVIDTPMVEARGPERKAIYTGMTEANVIPRAGTAAEVAHGILFLVENDFVTGTTVDVDGGWLVP